MTPDLQRSPYHSPRTLWALCIGFLLVWFYMLGVRTLVPTDEGRYAEMAREMVATGDWITLRLNGIKYFEKPPLQNWMNAITFSLFGLGDWQARLWTGLCGLIGIFSAAYTAFKFYGCRVGINTGLILGSSFYWVTGGHVNTLDMGLSAMMTLCLCGLLLAQRDGATAKERRNGMLLCWSGMALATLSKGLIGFVLPGAVLVIYTFWTRDFSLWMRLHIVKGLMVFFAITAPWFILIWQANPEHPYFFFIHEHFQRFTSNVHKRGGPWWYFFPLLAIGMIPWLGFVVHGLLDGVLSEKSKKERQFHSKKMLVIWSIFIFFFFSISGSKLPSYILPIFPAVAILIAATIDSLSTRIFKMNAAILMLVALVCVCLAFFLPQMQKESFVTPLYQAMTPYILLGALLMLVGGAIGYRHAATKRDTAIIVIAASAFFGGQVITLGMDQFGQYKAGVHHIKAIKAELQADTPLYTVGLYEQSLPFYLRRTTILVEHPDELEFGLGIQPELWIAKRSDFIATWRTLHQSGKKAVAILKPEVYVDLKDEQLPMRVIGQDPLRVIVAIP
ncbi:MAG: glycosyltransferase family 39 protein [Burkholderiales bacterium]|nr:glycosyltransferase family 39 protein [Burkholderiales bacterium]